MPISRDSAAGGNWPNGRATNFRMAIDVCVVIFIGSLVHDERKETARNEHVGAATPARGSHVGGIGARQDTRIAAGFVAAVATQVAAH